VYRRRTQTDVASCSLPAQQSALRRHASADDEGELVAHDVNPAAAAAATGDDADDDDDDNVDVDVDVADVSL